MKWVVILDPYDGPHNMATVGPYDTKPEADDVAQFLWACGDVGVDVIPLHEPPKLSLDT